MSVGSSLHFVEFHGIPGWSGDDLAGAWDAFRRSCREIVDEGRAFSRSMHYGGTREDWLGVCRPALALPGDVAPDGVRRFFETNFRAFAIEDEGRREGLFTGYYEPEAEGSLERSARFAVPIYAKPRDLVTFDADAEKASGIRYGRLVQGKPRPYWTRREIEEGALAGRGLELVWLASWADAFFIHVQGSGRVRLPDGRVMRLAFSGKNGLPYTAIGGVLVKRGEVPAADMSMQAIRAWLARHPDRGRDLMWENSSFVFFRETRREAHDLGPPGAQLVGLTPNRSLAVDRAFWAFGTPLWIDTEVPDAAGGASRHYRRLMFAQDTGSAIKGAIRGDVFFGTGEDAGAVAGLMKGRGRMIALLPNSLARRLDAGR